MTLSWTCSLFIGLTFACVGCATTSAVMQEGLDAEPLSDERPYIVGGRKDAGNVYLSTVIVDADGVEGADCSGILISPRLVLTAGHWVCTEQPIRAPVGEARTIIDGSLCSPEVAVATKSYGNPARLTRYSAFKVVPHPELQLFYRGDGFLMQGRADLAIIHLKDAIDDIPAIRLADTGVRPGSAIAIVGYGFTDLKRTESGERYYGNTNVAEVQGETFLVEKPGPHAFHGDSGGPCLRWLKGVTQPVLVGIIRGGAAPAYSTFTSTTVPRNRDWIEAVKREAEKQDAESVR
jgi:hypothetical protein